MQAILETGYTGFVAKNSFPLGPTKVQALRHAAMVCDGVKAIPSVILRGCK